MNCIKHIFFPVIILLLFSHVMWAQSDSKKYHSKNRAADKVINSLEKNESDSTIAQNYETLAKELSSNGDYEKAEEYLKKARHIYQKQKNKDKLAYIDRELAKVQEAQNKIDEAISNYNSASKLSKENNFKILNSNDANRLGNIDNPVTQQSYIMENIRLSDDMGKKEDQALALQQMAQTKIVLDDKTGAINDLNEALNIAEEIPGEAIKINTEIAKIYLSENQTEKAIDINEKLLKNAREENNKSMEISQLQSLSSNYFEIDKNQEGLLKLQQAYDLAISENRTIDAKESLELLVERYNKEKNIEKTLEIYNDFINELDILLTNDSTLINEKAFQIQEDKISQLEKERELKDELIAQSRSFNTVLLISIILILLFLIFIIRSLLSIKKKNKKIALQSLRREMNPHFIFNSLNSVNHFIAQNNEIEANKYLSSYSKLMRNIMENSNKDFIPLSLEIEHIRKYMELEYMRFRDKFNFKIEIDNTLDTDSILIPNMLIQPQLENAIWHGLRYKEGIGLLTLNIKPENNKVTVTIEDDGVGIKKSKELKTRYQKEHKSRGLTNTYERIKLLNSLYGTDISIDISEKDNGSGVIVIFNFPLKEK